VERLFVFHSAMSDACRNILNVSARGWEEAMSSADALTWAAERGRLRAARPRPASEWQACWAWGPSLDEMYGHRAR
jgi:hypothetical protein